MAILVGLIAFGIGWFICPIYDAWKEQSQNKPEIDKDGYSSYEILESGPNYSQLNNVKPRSIADVINEHIELENYE